MNVSIRRTANVIVKICLVLSAVASGGCQRTARAQGRTTPAAPATLRSLYGMPRPVRLDPSRTALVLVDFQEEFFHGKLFVPDGRVAAKNAGALLRWARATGVQIAHVRNVAVKWDSPLFAPASPTVAFFPTVAPVAGEAVVTKSSAGGFTRTDLDARLRAKNVDTIVVGGLMTHLAVDSTVRDGALLGYHVIVAADATATRDLPAPGGGAVVESRDVQRSTLAALADRFADVLSTREIEGLPLAPR
jgi:nicotinamidase-related amidase